jgi:hypothetical protein
MIDNFYESFDISIFLREFNQLANSLVVEANTFKTLAMLQVKYEIDMRYRPSIPTTTNIGKFLKISNKSKSLWR